MTRPHFQFCTACIGWRQLNTPGLGSGMFAMLHFITVRRGMTPKWVEVGWTSHFHTFPVLGWYIYWSCSGLEQGRPCTARDRLLAPPYLSSHCHPDHNLNSAQNSEGEKMGMRQNLVPPVTMKIAGKWMFLPQYKHEFEVLKRNHMVDTWKRGTAKSPILVGFSFINHPFWSSHHIGKMAGPGTAKTTVPWESLLAGSILVGDASLMGTAITQHQLW